MTGSRGPTKEDEKDEEEVFFPTSHDKGSKPIYLFILGSSSDVAPCYPPFS